MSHRTLFYYDQESNLTCVRDADNGLTYYTYDLLNRMTSLKNPFGEVTYYDYTPDGQVKKRTLGNSTLTYYEHDDVGRVSKLDNRKSDLSVISTFEYEYDKVGNPAKITREDGSATYYRYDRIYQLTGETQVDDQGQVEYAFEYQYDKAHNRTVKVDNGTPTYYAYNEANELTDETTDGQTTYYQYDRCGNTTAKQEPSGTTYYLYDTENLMTRIDFADGSHNYFGYDADSKRVSKEDSEGFTKFIYQGPDMLKLLLERDDQGETQAHYTMGDGLEAIRRDTASSFYHYNHLGTTHELTDAAQNITDTYRHDAWGVPLARTGSTVNPHTYVGRQRYYWMPCTILYQAGVTDYAPERARLMSMNRLTVGLLSVVHPGCIGSSEGARDRAVTGSADGGCWALPVFVPSVYSLGVRNPLTLPATPLLPQAATGAMRVSTIDWGRAKRCTLEAGCMLAVSGLVCIGAALAFDEVCAYACVISAAAGPEALGACLGGCLVVGELLRDVCLVAVALPWVASDVIACATTGGTACLDSAASMKQELCRLWRRYISGGGDGAGGGGGGGW